MLKVRAESSRFVRIPPSDLWAIARIAARARYADAKWAVEKLRQAARTGLPPEEIVDVPPRRAEVLIGAGLRPAYRRVFRAIVHLGVGVTTSQVAEAAGVSQRTASEAVTWLFERGVIEVEARFGGAYGNTRVIVGLPPDARRAALYI